MTSKPLTAEHIRRLAKAGRHDLLRKYKASLTPLALFRPRPDSPEEFDEQTSFMNSKAKFSVLLGGNACIAGESEIYDPVAGKYLRVDQVDRPFHVIAWDGQRAVMAEASKPFVKGVADLYRVTMSDGQEFVATAKHRVLNHDEQWIYVEQLVSRRPQSAASHLRSNSGTCLRAFQPSAGHSFHTPADSQADCQPDHRFCDARLRLPVDTVPAPPRQPAYAHAHSQPYWPGDGQEPALAHSQPYQPSDRHAMPGFYGQPADQRDAFESHAFCRPSTPAWGTSLALPLFQSQRAHRAHTTPAFARPANQFYSKFPLETLSANTTHVVKVQFERRDTYYDLTVAEHHNYWMAGVFHHNSGKTICAAVKTARYLRDTPPPRRNCPFWILGETFEQTCSTCWDEKLSHYIDPADILAVDWYKPKRNWPRAVVLRDPKNRNEPGWVIEFKSYDQGVLVMQGRSIGGYWFNEEAPLEIVSEVQVRCRDYDSPGWADFTPAHIRDARWPELYEAPPKGWKFFRLNTFKNKTKKVQKWASTYFDSIPEDERETRSTGAFAGFSGQVFKEFYRPLHVINGETTEDPQLREIAYNLERHEMPASWRRIRGIDFGWSNPLACIWIAVDPDGRYYCYDEHYQKQWRIERHAESINARPWRYNHPAYGVTYCDNEEPASINYLNELNMSPEGKFAHFRPVEKMPLDIGRQLSDIRKMLMVQGDGRPKIYFLAKCKNLIREVRGYRWQEGAKGPNSANPREIPVSRDDHCLVAGTMIETERGPVPIENVTSSDRVWTRQGWKRVLWSGPTRFDTPYCVSLSNDSRICGTEDHPVWVVGRGMTHIDALQPGDRVLSLSETCPCRNQSTRQPFALCSRGCPTGDTHIPTAANCESISSPPAASDYTAQFGSTIADQSRPATTSTTATATHLTTPSKTSNACRLTNIYPSTPPKSGQTPRGARQRPSDFEPETQPEKCTLGATRPRDAKSDARPARNHGTAGSQSTTLALTAEPCTHRSSQPKQGFAPSPARPPHGASQESTTSNECASFAESPSQLAATASQKVVPVVVVDVSRMQHAEQTYDLTVEDAHEFFANGILVHNSVDAMRYAIIHDARGPRRPAQTIRQNYKRESVHLAIPGGR